MNSFEPSIPAMRLVLEIVKTGKLTRAASRLRISQSGASHALGVLESQIGVALFVREWEGLRLSEAGLRLLPHIERALGNLDAIRAEAAGVSQLKAGNLRIAAVPSLLATILPPIIREYGARFPGIELTIFEGTDDEVRAWILSGMVHVGFAALPVEGVSGEQVDQDEWLALVAEDMFPGRSSITLRELARHKFLMSGGGCETHIQRIFSAAHIELPGPSYGKAITDDSGHGHREARRESGSKSLRQEHASRQPRTSPEAAFFSADRNASVPQEVILGRRWKPGSL